MIEKISVSRFLKIRRRKKIDNFEFLIIEIITVNLNFINKNNKIRDLINNRIIIINYFNFFIRRDNFFFVNFTI